MQDSSILTSKEPRHQLQCPFNIPTTKKKKKKKKKNTLQKKIAQSLSFDFEM
jgi:hypothetical protein